MWATAVHCDKKIENESEKIILNTNEDFNIIKKEELIIVEEWLHLEAHNEPKEAVQRENE
jgi:hypothetical protein